MSIEPGNKEPKQVSGTQIISYFSTLIHEFLSLEEGVDKWGTIKAIKAKQSMSGANAWMLMCSIVIASIGLNLNSQAVIIGAMLISPLMSPILGIGLGVAINDKDALIDALMHFGAAILIALIFSTLYFWMTPLDEFTEQIQARTEPTFLDILVGIFGGVAGIVSYARKDISTAIPGVAIATALMPPLCVTGFGLANGDWDVASKSFYLFFLNSFFVAFSTYLVLRYLKFPYKEFASKAERKKNVWRIVIFSILMVIPSIIIFINIYKDYVREHNIEIFIDEYIGDNEIFLDNYTLRSKPDGTNTLYLKVYGEVINEKQVPRFERALDSLGIRNVNVQIIPTSEIPLQKIKELESEISQVGGRLNTQIQQLKDERDARQKLIEAMNNSAQFLMNDSTSINKACEELKIFIPEINRIGLAFAKYSDGNGQMSYKPTAIIESGNELVTEEVQDKVEKYLQSQFKVDSLMVIFVQPDN